jgi:hypothetical protein
MTPNTIIVVENAIGQPEEEEDNLALILSGPDFDSIYYQGEDDDETVEEIHS